MTTASQRIDTAEVLRPPALETGPLGYIRKTFFSSWLNTIVTLVCIYTLWRLIPPIVEWAFINAVWTGNREMCRAAQAEGLAACWAFIGEKFEFMMFGFFPADDRWRPATMVGIFLSMIVASAFPKLWRRELFYAWVVALAVMYWLMAGGLGLTPVATKDWGGFALTLGVAVIAIVCSFPLGVVLALGRRSKLPVIKTLCVMYIELIRGVPLITVLFMSQFVFPLLLPAGATVDKLLRAQIGLILFSAAYIAEIVRGGLQAMPRGQFEAADSLGLGYWQTMRLIILPQALKITIPAQVNSAIGLFKDTSLLLIIGIFDLMSSMRGALSDTDWLGFNVEAYAFVAVVYFVFCFAMSRYSLYLEKRLSPERKR